MNRSTTFVLVVALLGGAAFLIWRQRFATPAPLTLAVATTQPTSRPTTGPLAATTKPTALTYVDVVRRANPLIPATQPLALPVVLTDAAHIVLHEPVYLDPLGHLWITRADAKPTNESLRAPADPPEHVIREVPVYIHWWVDDNGEWQAAVVTHKPGGGGYEFITHREPIEVDIERAFRWEQAFSWDGKIIVPADQGISVFDVQPNQVREHYHALPGMPPAGTVGVTTPLAVLDTKGVLAWAPWDNGHTGSRGASRFIDGNWSDLTTEQWAAKLVQLIPLLDGSILQIVAGDGDHVTLNIAPLESVDIDSHKVDDLVNQLSDADEDKRRAAFTELSRYGPGLWPMLEKTLDDQPAEARIAIKQLLRSRVAPALSGMTPMDDRLSVVNRQNDGSALFYSPVGVRISHGQDDPEIVAPAWISLRPGGRVERPLPAALVADQRPDMCHLRAVRDDWVLCDDAGLPRRFVGNGFVPLVRAEERDFSQLLGQDRRGRWLFTRHDSGDTLILDPTILDPTPRLPVWTMVIQNGLIGWDGGDWPVIKRGGAWALKADTWEPLSDKSSMITDVPAIARTTPPPDTTQPTTTESLGSPLRVTADGTRYYNGRDALVVVDKSGKQIHWPLPASAVGAMDPPTLIRTADGKLFLFNQAGRVLRIARTPDGPEPFTIEATFTKDIPNTDHPTRIWLDPLGRIDMAFDGNSLAIMFPSGHIPPEISAMMMDASN
jgi:hypothetical protein